LKTEVIGKIAEERVLNVNEFQSKRDMFTVDFEQEIPLESTAVKYNLVFNLEGPPTYGLDPTKLEETVEKNGVKFFFWPGSKQMPVLRCSLHSNPR